jgi:PAS domain S-box-containing protein
MINVTDIRVLIIDDDEDDYFIISDYIKEIEGNRFTVDWCADYDTAVRNIRERKYDIYFVDYRLGIHTGLDLLQEACVEEFCDPVVLLTGKGNKSIDIKAMESGAADYLIKSELNAEKLERCIRYSLDRASDLRELKAREDKYRNLFENSKDAIFIADDSLTFSEVNYSASLLFSEETEKLRNRSLLDFINAESQRQELSALFLQTDNINDYEIEIKNQKGEVKPCLLSLSLFEDHDDGYLTHGILHDITSMKKAETANLQAQKLAANERLMRTLAHEIRNPLNNINLSLEQLLVPADADEDQQGLVSIMQRNCTRINQIITELLDLTKPPDLTFKPCSLQQILDDSIAMSHDRINLQKIEVERKYPEHSLRILAHKSKLIIAFTNIIINAIEAMETGKGKLIIGIDDLPAEYVVTIHDNGKGIPEEYLAKLFEPFFTLKKNGIGLGLAASYSIFQSHKAEVSVKSEINKGTNFMIRFSKNN